MKVTKRQLRQIIEEQTATVSTDTIEDVVMGVLSDEGGAAGLEPIEDALEDLEDDDISLPDEDIEDIIGDVAGVKSHTDGDFIDTTQLEGKTVKISKRQLRRIIKEEKAKVLAEAPTGEFGIFDKYYLTSVLMEEVERFMDQTGADSFGPAEVKDMRSAVMYALDVVTREVS